MEIREFFRRVYKELFDNILDFWSKQTVDTANGGFIGKVTFDGIPLPESPKALVLNTRILWTFSSICLYEKKDIYYPLAQRAFDYLIEHFLDEKYGGAYWMLNNRGRPIDTCKELYGQAFLIYALVEYYKVTQDIHVLQLANKIFDLVEDHCYDNVNGGYFESFKRDWTPVRDSRLSSGMLNESKSTITHLQLLEAYTSLCQVWKDGRLFFRLKELIDIFQKYIINPDTLHFSLFFNEKWKPLSDEISFGYDIEGSWVLCDAARVLGNKDVISEIEGTAVKMVDVTMEEGLDLDSGLFFHASQREILDYDKHWWPQAEAAVGFLNAYMITRKRKYFDAALNIWRFVENNLVDKVNKEWHWKVSRGLEPVKTSPKVSPWKGPFHNGRACIEILRRLYYIKSFLVDQIPRE